MNVVVTDQIKGKWLQIRIDEDIKADVKVVAKLRGLSMSALVHSMLVKAVREEKAVSPDAFHNISDKPLSGKKQTIAVLKEKAK